MKNPKTPTGFTTLDSILAAILIGAISLAGYFAWQNYHRIPTPKPKPAVVTTTPKTSATPSPSPTPTPTPNGGYATYHSTYEGASFTYPVTWKFEEVAGLDPANPEAHTVNLTSPHGLKLIYNDFISGLGGGCPPERPHVLFSSLQPLSGTGSPSGDSVYLAQNPASLVLADQQSLPQGTSLDSGSCLFYPSLTSKLHPDTQLTFGTSFALTSASPQLPATQQVDLPAAMVILRSFHY